MKVNEFIDKAIKIHNGKYDYSKVEYVNGHTKVCIICPSHGEFWQSPYNHLKPQGCPECKREKLKVRNNLSQEEVLRRAQKTHGDKYDYSQMIYTKLHDKVTIICNTCGLKFSQEIHSHLNGCGCPRCNKHFLNQEEFIRRSRELHGDRYDYSKVQYVTAKKNVEIICPIHGSFTQMPYKHLIGHGCPQCKASHLEEEVRLLLEKCSIEYVYEQRFDWLGKQSLDFYLPQYNIAIECQGVQHFRPVGFGLKDKGDIQNLFLQIQKNDKKKKILCEEHDIKLIYFSNTDYKTFLKEKVYNQIVDLEVLLTTLEV